MSDFKMLERVLAHSTELGWAEQEAIITHCLWSQDKSVLLDWLKDLPAAPLLIHIRGRAAMPQILSVDPSGPIEVVQGTSVREALALPDDPFDENDVAFQLSQSDAVRIVCERDDISSEQLQNASESYADIMKTRFVNEPFVHLTAGARALPIKVPILPR